MKELDLHGVKHEDVPNTVKRWIEDNFSSEGIGLVITGNSNMMKELVLNELSLYAIDNRVLSGSIYVYF